MSANQYPSFPNVYNVSFGTLAAANTAKDGTGAVTTVFTAGANGAYVDGIRCQALGTNVATVLRVFLNNGQSSAAAANNSLIAELQLPSSTLSEAAAQVSQNLPIQKDIPAGYKLNVVISTAVAAGWQVTAFGGNF